MSRGGFLGIEAVACSSDTSMFRAFCRSISPLASRSGGAFLIDVSSSSNRSSSSDVSSLIFLRSFGLCGRFAPSVNTGGE